MKSLVAILAILILSTGVLIVFIKREQVIVSGCLAALGAWHPPVKEYRLDSGECGNQNAADGSIRARPGGHQHASAAD
jgi:hypothetical protein